VKPADRPKPNHAASRLVALDICIAFSGKLFDGGVQRIHAACFAT
jgi:hypothetical protein